MIQFPNPVVLMGNPYTLTITDDAAFLSGLAAAFGDPGPAPVIRGEGISEAEVCEKFAAGALTFDPAPLCSGAGAANFVDATGNKIATVLLGRAR